MLLPPRSQAAAHIKGQESFWQSEKKTNSIVTRRKISAARSPIAGKDWREPVSTHEKIHTWPSPWSHYGQLHLRRPQSRNPPKITPQPHPSTGLTGTQNKFNSSQLRVIRPRLYKHRVLGKPETRKVVSSLELPVLGVVNTSQLTTRWPTEISCFFSIMSGFK